MARAASTKPRLSGKNGAGSGRRREREVLEAAAKVFHSRGYADASVQDIADELGILKGSLYHYIDSKEDLLFWLLSETHDDVDEILEQVEAEADAKPLAKLHEYTRRSVEYTSRNLARMSIYYHDSDQLSPTRQRELIPKRKKHEKFVTKLIEAAQKEGKADKKADARLTTNFLFGSMIWVYRWYKPGSKPKAADVASACADFVIDGIVGAKK